MGLGICTPALYTRQVIHTISQLRPGLVVLQPVRDSRGQALLPAGATLTESVISLLSQRGVQAVDVQASESPEEREARIAHETARIDATLPPGIQSPELQQLRRILLETAHG